MARRRTFSRRRKYTKKRRTTRRRFTSRNNRPSQRLKRTRWPTRNPFGDTLSYKVRVVTAKATTMTAGTNFANIIPPTQFNSMPSLSLEFDSAPGLITLGTNFARYRISGVNQRITVWTKDAATDVPCYISTQASATSAELGNIGTNIQDIAESRWGSYKMVKIAGNGATPTVLNQYYSVGKISGPDSTVKGDTTYTGNTTASNPDNWEAINTGPWMRAVCSTMTGLPNPVAQQFWVQIETTIYLKFWQRRNVLL